MWKGKSGANLENENENMLINRREMLDTLSHCSALPEHILSLKKEAIIMLLRNVGPKTGQMNGATYVVENITSNVLFLRIAIAMQKGAKLNLVQFRCRPQWRLISGTELQASPLSNLDFLRFHEKSRHKASHSTKSWGSTFLKTAFSRPAACIAVPTRLVFQSFSAYQKERLKDK